MVDLIPRLELSDLEPRITAEDAKIRVGNLPAIEADPGQMHQLFLNLIANSLKFRRPGVQPSISIEGGSVSSMNVISRWSRRSWTKPLSRDFTTKRLENAADSNSMSSRPLMEAPASGGSGRITTIGMPDQGSRAEA